ncbi:hypothetical protein [Kitasatospora sp. NPDC101183]|uniref:hypothetical protein n=1 Tax=Kitasatospora sp. NPDC101183 TaxID=3364100 RepID=UPI0037FD709D
MSGRGPSSVAGTSAKLVDYVDGDVRIIANAGMVVEYRDHPGRGVFSAPEVRTRVGLRLTREAWTSLTQHIRDEAAEANWEAVEAENRKGGEAREVVAQVARALGVDIDAGPGSCWDMDHMLRVVEAAKALSAEGPLRETIVRQALRITELEKGSAQ